MRVKVTDRCKVWEINDKNGYAEIKFSTSRKVKEDSEYDKIQIDNGVAKNGYIAEYQSFVKFVGHAYNKLKDVKIGDSITNLVADFNREPYWDSKNNCISYPKNLKTTVFDFDFFDYENQNINLDKAPQVADDNKYQKEPVVSRVQTAEELKAADECPF